MITIESNRQLLKANFDMLQVSDQQKGVPVPPIQKPYDDNAVLYDLPDHDDITLVEPDIHKCLKNRRSRRHFTNKGISLLELSFLLWATQGIDEVLAHGEATLRPSPSAGARHPIETYIAAHNVTGLPKAVYRYLPMTHQLVHEFTDENMTHKIIKACLGQEFAAQCGATFLWSCIPYRGEWRYTIAAAKTMLIDAGHLCQNLYLSSEAIGCGTCAIAAYDQKAIDNFLKLDGEDEFIVYIAPVGKL